MAKGDGVTKGTDEVVALTDEEIIGNYIDDSL